MRNTTKTISSPVPDDEPVVAVELSECEKEGKEKEVRIFCCYSFSAER